MKYKIKAKTNKEFFLNVRKVWKICVNYANKQDGQQILLQILTLLSLKKWNYVFSVFDLFDLTYILNYSNRDTPHVPLMP